MTKLLELQSETTTDKQIKLLNQSMAIIDLAAVTSIHLPIEDQLKCTLDFCDSLDAMLKTINEVLEDAGGQESET